MSATSSGRRWPSRAYWRSSSSRPSSDCGSSAGTGCRGRFALLHGLFDLLLDVFQIDVQVGEDCRRNPLTLTDKAEEDVLRPHVFVMQTGRFLSSHLQDFADTIGEVVSVHLGTLRSSEGLPLRLIRDVPLRIPALCARTVPAGREAPDRWGPPLRLPPNEPVGCTPTTCSVYTCRLRESD